MKSDLRTFKKIFFCFLLFTNVPVIALCAQQDSTTTRRPQYREADYPAGDKVLSGDVLRRASTGNLWNAIVALEPSLVDNGSDLYGDVPYYTPQSNTLQGTTAWSLDGSNSSVLFLIDGAQVSAYQFMCLNINDIEKIIIYKDARSLTRFGTKGGNGAIEAVLRKPDAGKLHINYLFDAQLQTVDRSNRHLPAEISGTPGYDWKEAPLRTAFSHRHKLDIGGGDRYVKYNFSVEGDPAGRGVMQDDYHKTLGLSNYIAYQRNAVSISNHLSFYQSKNNASPYGTYDYYLSLSPELSPYNDEGKIATLLPDGSINPLHEVSTGSFNKEKIHTIQDRLKATITLPADLYIEGSFSFTRETAQNDLYISPSSGRYVDAEEGSYTGRYDITRDNQLAFEGDLALRYDKKWKKSAFGTSLAVAFLSEKCYGETLGGYGILNDRMAYISFTQSYSDEEPVATREYDHNLAGLFSAQYQYDNRYGVSAGLRIEKSSLLATRARTALFYNAGLYWNLHNEAFLRNSGLEQLTLALSHGTSGGIGFANNAYTITYDNNIGNEYIYNYYLIGSSIVLMPNDRLRWYTVMRDNLSLSARYRNFAGSLLFYSRITTNLPVITSLPLSTGYPYTFGNGGKISNRGIEGSLSVDLLPGHKGLSLLTFASVAYNINRIEEVPAYFASLYNEAVARNAETAGTAAVAGFLQPGYSVTELYSTDPATGQLTAEGPATPTVQGNWGLSGTCGKWQFNLLTTFSAGAKAYDADRASTDLNPYVSDNRFTLRNVQVGYTFPLWKVAGLTVIASGENLVRYTSAHGNIGYYYPCARTFTLALRLQL